MLPALILPNRRLGHTAARFDAENAPNGTMSVLPATSPEGDGDWWPSPVTSVWSRAEVLAAADWWAAAADPRQPRQPAAAWFGTPAVGFLVIERDRGTAAVDVCWLEHADAVRPSLTGCEADPVAGDQRFSYVTIDLDLPTLSSAAVVLLAWADAD